MCYSINLRGTLENAQQYIKSLAQSKIANNVGHSINEVQVWFKIWLSLLYTKNPIPIIIMLELCCTFNNNNKALPHIFRSAWFCSYLLAWVGSHSLVQQNDNIQSVSALWDYWVVTMTHLIFFYIYYVMYIRYVLYLINLIFLCLSLSFWYLSIPFMRHDIYMPINAENYNIR
jgi:hypothetical protein